MKKQYVAGFLMTFDLDRYLLIDKAKKPAAGEDGVLTTLRWCGIGGNLEPAKGGNWYLTEDYVKEVLDPIKGTVTFRKDNYGTLKYWDEAQVPRTLLLPRDFETPHQAMEREFIEETGYEKIKWHRWHCFMIKEYTHAKIYMFVAFCSPDEMLKIRDRYPDGIGPEGQIQIHNVIDIFFDPDMYTFDVPYLMNMVVRESRRGFISKLDPESVNTIARQPK